VTGLDGAKKGVVLDTPPAATLDKDVANLERLNLLEGNPIQALLAWWNDEGKPHSEEDRPRVFDADKFGGRMALRWTSIVPACMAGGYLLLFLYFAATGGYKQEHLHGKHEEGEEYLGGTEGPTQA
jgi:hypothetical protein